MIAGFSLRKEMEGWCIALIAKGIPVSRICYENDLARLAQMDRDTLYSILVHDYHGKYIGNFKIYFWDNKKDALQVIDWLNSILVAEKLAK
jgi:hypothetical protein